MPMINRVARAIHTVLPPAAISGAPIAWDDMSDEARADYAVAARRAIAAMRFATDAMINQGDRRDLARDAANIWERMVYTAMGPEDGA